jgi:glycine/D-amino acid oxidase-like deaminating enzyme
MKIDYLLIGQGISGTWLSYFLQKENKSFMVMDDKRPNAPSRLAAGIINPVTGRRHVSTWMIETLLPYVWDKYNQLGSELGITAISQKNVTDFFPSPQMRESFVKRVEEKGAYVSLPAEQEQFRPFINYEFGYGEIQPVYTAHLESIIPAWRLKLMEQGLLREEQRSDHCA